ncbi:hypothetical protein QQ045_022016 [Rhodiola kirilowii]
MIVGGVILDLVTYSSIIHGFLIAGKWEEANRLVTASSDGVELINTSEWSSASGSSALASYFGSFVYSVVADSSLTVLYLISFQLISNTFSLRRKAGLDSSQIDWLLLHQANQRILDPDANRLNFPSEHVISNLANYGNTSAASIPLALDEAVRSGKVKPGHIIAAAGFGAGLTWGSVIIRWG